MTKFDADDDPVLSEALDEFCRTPDPAAPSGVLVSLLEAQAAAKRRPRGVPAWAAAAVVAVALAAGFWAGRSTDGPTSPGRPTGVAQDTVRVETAVPTRALPVPPPIPFVST